MARALFASLLVGLLAQYLALWIVLPVLAGAGAVRGVEAPTVAHGPLIQRWLTPILVLAYAAFLVVVAGAACDRWIVGRPVPPDWRPRMEAAMS